MIDIDKLIAEAMKNKQRERLDVLKLIKAEFIKIIHSESNIDFDDSLQIRTLIKMVEQRKDSIEQYKKGGREDLAEAEQKEIDVISEFIPAQPTDKEIVDFSIETIKGYCVSKGADYKVSMKDMKPILNIVKEKYPTANGKIVSEILKNQING